MSASLAGVYNFQAFKSTGDLAASYRLYTYSPSTTTHKDAYTEPTGVTTHTYTNDGGGGQYIAVNARGELPAPLFLATGGYDLCLKTDAGVTVWTRRAYGTNDSSSTLQTDLADATNVAKGAGMIGADLDDLTYAHNTIGAAVQDLGISVLWFMTSAQRASVLAGNLTEDVTTPVQDALNAAAGKSVFFPDGRYKITSGLTVGNRTKIFGAGPTNSEIVYRTASTSTNQLFDFDNVDNIHVSDIGVTNSNSSGGQNTTAFLLQGDSGSVTEVMMSRVYIDGFMNYGVRLHTGALYVILSECRIMNCTNDVASGGTGAANAAAISCGTTVNALRIDRCRISANDEAIESDVTAKYSLTIAGSSFETNGETGTPADTINLYNWRSVVFSGNYCEANKTGTAVDNSFLRLQACGAVHVVGNFINGSSGGVGKSKNLIGISDTTVGVVIESNELDDPITKIVYVVDGNSLASLRRNKYSFGAVYITSYADIMARMTASLVELDVGHAASINTGSIATLGNYQTDVTVTGVDVTRNISVTVTPLNGGGGFVWHGSATASDTIRVTAFNVNGVNNSFNGTVVIRMLKDG